MTLPKRDLRKICFFCSKPIEEKKSLEHIIPDSLLGKLGIKEAVLEGEGKFQYSRIKVPAHILCNSGFGSEYENRIIELLDNPKKLYEDLKGEESNILSKYTPNDSLTMIISTWLCKIYYGLFYNDYLKLKESEFTKIAKDIIDSKNFKIIQESYKDGVGFCIPSSLYVFNSKNLDFDLKTNIYPESIMLKVKSLTMILCIGDGFLTKNYLTDEVLKVSREFLSKEEKKEPRFPVHLYALSEILALRMHIPKSPSFIYVEKNKEILNMSFMTGVNNPEKYYAVDVNSIEKKRNEILNEFNVKMNNN